LHYCRIHLERYKVPKQIKFVEVIPRTDNGKLKRKELREGEKKINV
jgi:long-chain acyl-CoA synthetase